MAGRSGYDVVCVSAPFLGEHGDDAVSVQDREAVVSFEGDRDVEPAGHLHAPTLTLDDTVCQFSSEVLVVPPLDFSEVVTEPLYSMFRHVQLPFGYEAHSSLQPPLHPLSLQQRPCVPSEHSSFCEMPFSQSSMTPSLMHSMQEMHIRCGALVAWK